MKSAAFLIASCLALVPSLGCSSRDESGPARVFLSLGTAPAGGAFFVVGGAISETLNEALAPLNWRVTAEATMGSQENIRRLVAGELDLALSNSAITYFAVRGEGEWGRPQAIQSIMTLAPNVALFVSPERSGVRTIPDLKGRRVLVGPAGAGFEFFVAPLLEAHGVAYADFTPLYGTQAAAVDMLADGSAAAAFLGGAIPTASITQAAASQNLRFIPFDPTARERLIRDFPFFRSAVIPAGTYRGLSEDFQALDVGSMHLITSAAMDEDLVYRVTRAVYENRTRVAETHAAGKSITAENVVRATGTDFHFGAIRYYREIGIWPESKDPVEASNEPTR